MAFETANRQVVNPSNASDIHFSLPEDNLPHLITAIEGKLGTTIGVDPTIHIVVYVPPCDASPLHIYNKRGERASTNGVDSFYSARWGGIIIANPTREDCEPWMKEQQKAELFVHSHQIMHVAVYLLRRVIGVHIEIPPSMANVVEWESVVPRAWEIDSFMRVGAVQLISSSITTLQSLVQLLGKKSIYIQKRRVPIDSFLIILTPQMESVTS